MIFVAGQRPPYVNLDAIPREITVKAGRRVDLEIPYTGKFVNIVSFHIILLVLAVHIVSVAYQGYAANAGVFAHMLENQVLCRRRC